MVIGSFGKLMTLPSRSRRPQITLKVCKNEWEVKAHLIHSRMVLR